jgi:epidermal growth factor receptor substrate 15
MASSGAPPPVPSNYQPIFEGYWKQCDAGNTGKVVAVDAASFLKSSQLKESTLHKIWTLVDPKGKGYLDKEAFFTAVRLVAVCQAGKEPTISNITAKDPLPQFNPVKPSTKPWIIDAEERKRSISMFHNMQPEKGKVSGEKAKQMFLKSGLSTDVLGKIWTLSDTDCDGALTISEFSIAIHLIGRCRGGEPVPTVLPPALKIAASSISSSPLPVRRESSSGEWLITPEMKAKYDQYFSGIDKDKDGFVTGDESKGLFMASNLPSAVLAEIWNLIDTKSSGKLNAEQFAVAMYLISEKVKGGEIPKPLPANLIPPSMREEAVAKVSTAPTQSLTPLKTPSNVPPASSGTILPPVMAPSKTTPVPASQPSVTIGTDSMDGFSAIKQLDSLNTELESLTKEKESLQHEVREKEKAIVDSKDEVQVLKESLAKVQFTCQELGKEKMAAQEQLDRLDQEKTSVEKQLTDAKREIEELKSSVEQVRTTLQGKEEAMKAQSEELQKLQSDLHDLKKEEAQLKIEVDSSREDLQKAQQSVGKTKAEITQTQKKIASLKTEKKTITDTFAEITNLSFDTAVPPGKTSTDGPDEGLLHLRSEVDSVSAVATAGSSSPLSSLSGLSEFEHKDESTSGSKMTSDPFGSTTSEDPFSSMGGFGGNSSFGSNSFSKTPTGTSTTASNFSDPFTVS